jgi:hypothetical protein
MQGAELMAKFGINVPDGVPARTVEEVAAAAKSMADEKGEVLAEGGMRVGVGMALGAQVANGAAAFAGAHGRRMLHGAAHAHAHHTTLAAARLPMRWPSACQRVWLALTWHKACLLLSAPSTTVVPGGGEEPNSGGRAWAGQLHQWPQGAQREAGKWAGKAGHAACW